MHGGPSFRRLFITSAFITGALGLGGFVFFAFSGDTAVLPLENAERTENEGGGLAWNEYRDEAHGFRFSYPPGWDAETRAGGEVLLFRTGQRVSVGAARVGDIRVAILPNPTEDSIEAFYAAQEENFFETASSFASFRINGLTAVRFLGVPSRPPDTVVALKKDPYIIELTDVGSANQNNELFNKILVTLETITLE